MKRILLLSAILFFKITQAQYCGTSGPNICTTNNLLTMPGLMDYKLFPCVHDSVPFDEVIQFLVPTRQVYYDTPVISMQIDSITNLPCGLCWSCDDADRIYSPGARGCIRITGTSSEAEGIYPMKIYGRLTTPMGNWGLLNYTGFEFLIHVVGKNDSCNPVNYKHRSLACAPKNTDSCNLTFEFKLTRPTVNCAFDSAGLYVSKPTNGHLRYYWNVVDKNFDFFEDSVSVVKKLYNTDELVWVEIFDSLTGCTYYEDFSIISKLGPERPPRICYTTFDSTYGTKRGLQVVFEKNNWFQNFNRYDVYLQFDAGLPSRLVGSITSGSPGVVTDTMPQGADIYFIMNPSVSNYYSVLAYSDCLNPNDEWGGPFFNAPIIFVDSIGFSSEGYPSVYWMNSDPINYDRLYIFSRRPGGNWRSRMSTNDFSNFFWVDYHPDTTDMEYMVGFRLNASCDPNRSAEKMAFTNFGFSKVAVEKVDTSSIIQEPATIGTISRQPHINLFPNPASNKLQLQVDLSGDEEMSYVVFNMLGNRILTGKISQPLSTIDVTGLANGVYSLSLYNGVEKVGIRRFLKR